MSGSARGTLVPVGLAGIALLVGCGGSRTEGPRITDRPDGFVREAEYYAASQVLPRREVVHRSGYFKPGSARDSIVLTGYRGTTTAEEIREARDETARRWTYLKHGAPEELRIDGRRALAWTVTEERRGRVASREVVAVIPYPDLTYTIEFLAADPRYRDAAAMRRTVESFRRTR